MLISDKHEFIFVHIPKTAGSSIRSALEPHSNEKPKSSYTKLLRKFNLPKDYRKFSFKLHSTLAEVQTKMPESVYSDYKKIAFVRNPWDRLVSNFAYKVHGTKDKSRTRNDSFEEFIEYELQRKNRRQIDYLKNTDGELDCNFIGRFESLATDYQSLKEAVGIDLPPLATKNASKRQASYRDYYTQHTRDLVSSHYQEDIEVFGYSF